MNFPKSKERLIAYHEAGHAVLAILLDIPLESVSMEGSTVYKECDNILNRITVSQGGIFAARRYDKFGFCCIDDINWAMKILPKDQLLERFQREARRLVNKNKGCIAAVAKRLISAKSLTGEEVKRIVSNYQKDIK